MAESELDLPSKHTVDDNILSAGQPSHANLEAARHAAGNSIERALQTGTDVGLDSESSLYSAVRQALQ